jgi:hypothetical protein
MMRKFVIAAVVVLLAGALSGRAQAIPLAGALAARGAVEQSMPDQGVTKVWYHRHWRHYGWYRGHHYGWRHHHGRRYAYWNRY